MSVATRPFHPGGDGKPVPEHIAELWTAAGPVEALHARLVIRLGVRHEVAQSYRETSSSAILLAHALSGEAFDVYEQSGKFTSAMHEFTLAAVDLAGVRLARELERGGTEPGTAIEQRLQ